MRRDQAFMLDILDAARLIIAYLNGVSKEAFLEDTQQQDSVIRRIEIIGEAARRVSPATRDAFPEIHWSEMIGMRNMMIHCYDDIDLDIVWNTARDDLPRLIAQLESIVSPEAF
uniref:Uncharacterized conserved protein, contains HEPN domain n=1 Tax=Candidatus Kentrum sp. SD TaxID=2126332 RepID=A0A450YC19_9GAMM|nr:MAG: Uncharacterized conserved protein, contains HEPN domain [Candidatus Kentron sp. SD]VFK43843.1 MAG: Uncharacterized conserved protein, contains HEPN domain [Candidatus Kentron sp. SD]VFK78532.1 MAG: Uncharacterized conserved protein, contains HEPN domain [Candidatus Kentron sp. SD]